jgi:hypothetical protein
MLRAGTVWAYGSITAIPAGGSGWRYHACIERPLSGSLSAHHKHCQGRQCPYGFILLAGRSIARFRNNNLETYERDAADDSLVVTQVSLVRPGFLEV